MEIITDPKQTVLDADLRTDLAGGLQVYVAGEYVPAEDTDRQPAVLCTAVEAVHVPTVDEILGRFVAWMRLDIGDGKGPSPETVRSYMGDVRQHLLWVYEEGVTPATVTHEDLKEYRKLLCEAGAPEVLEPDSVNPPDRYALTTVGRKIASIRRFYGMAQAHGARPDNPAMGLKAPRDESDDDQLLDKRMLSYEEGLAVLKLPDVNKPAGIRNRAMLVMMAIHGCRVIEVSRLDLADVDMQAGKFVVLGKRSKRRVLTMIDESKIIFEKWLAVRNLMRVEDTAFFVTMREHDGSDHGRRMATRSIRGMVDRYFGLAGIDRDGVSCHSLRHWMATWSFAMGAPLRDVSKTLGHKSVTTTERYAHYIESMRNNPAQFLKGALG